MNNSLPSDLLLNISTSTSTVLHKPQQMSRKPEFLHKYMPYRECKLLVVKSTSRTEEVVVEKFYLYAYHTLLNENNMYQRVLHL